MHDNHLHKKEPHYLGPISFIPILFFLFLYLGTGLFFTAIGAEEPFKQFPRETALLVALIPAVLIGKGDLQHKMGIFTKSAGDSGTILMVVIFLLAGAFSGVTKATGGVESVVNLGLTLIPKQFLFAGLFLISAFIATAMGTSMGTIAAIGPIAVGVANAGDLHVGMAIASVLGGAMFGDNLSIISDTTIAATRGVGCEMRDKFRMNALIAGIAALVTIIIYSLTGASGEVTGDFSYNLIDTIPYIIVLATALMGLDVILVLLLGICSAGAIGLLSGSVDIIGLAQAAQGGMSGMYSVAIVSLLIRGLIGLTTYYGGIAWLMNKITSRIKSRKGAELGIGVLVAIIDFALANNTIAIIITSPLALGIAKQYNIARKRVASLLDIFSCIMQGILPHGGQMMLCMSLAGLAPTEIIPYAYYLYILLAVTLVTIFFGLMKTKEEKEGINQYPEEDEVDVEVEEAIA